jgi:hypothetical protein
LTPSFETVSGAKGRDLLQRVIRNRLRVRLEIPDSPYSWLTLLLALEGDRENRRLVIDPVPDFSRVFRLCREPGIILNFFDREGVPCSFATRVLAVQPREIWAAPPAEIIRRQRRAFYRVPAIPGMEIIFQDEELPGIRAAIKDYGLGGVAFYKDRGEGWFRRLVEEAELRENRLRIPAGKATLEIPISLAVVRRITVFHPECIRGALEFLQLPPSSRSLLTGLIFEQQRQVLQKIKAQEASSGRTLLTAAKPGVREGRIFSWKKLWLSPEKMVFI